MPVKASFPHSLLQQLPMALRAKMSAEGISQPALSRLLKVPQPQISRALAGKRKRLTEPMRSLCIYAGLLSYQSEGSDARQSVRALLDEMIGDSQDAARLLESVLLGLAPVLNAVRKSS